MLTFHASKFKFFNDLIFNAFNFIQKYFYFFLESIN